MSIWMIYFIIVILPGLNTLIGMMTALLLLLWVIFGAAQFIHKGEDGLIRLNSNVEPYFIRIVCLTILLLVLDVSTPNREQIKYLVGGYFVTNIEEIENIPPNLVNSMNKFLEDYSKGAQDEE